MSEEIIEIVMASARAFEREEFDAVERRWHPDAFITSPEGWPETGPFVGRDAVIAQFRRLISDMGEHRFGEMDVLAHDEEWVVVGFVWEVRGAGSGAPIASRITAAYRVEGGTIREGHFHWTPEEALAAAGLDRV